MKKSILFLALAFLLIATSALAVDPMLGGHEGHGTAGCMACHTPHNNAQNSATTTVTGSNKFFPTNTTVSWTLANSNSPLKSQYYLWGQGLSPVVYTTYDGGTVSAAQVAGKGSAMLHSLLCMSCHDTANSSYYMASYGPALDNTGSNSVGGSIPNADGTFAAASSGLTHSHPIHASYSTSTTSSRMWQVTVTSGVATFTNDNFALGNGFTGHAVKLWVDSADNKPYVECTTCHDPHRRTNFAYTKKDGTVVIGGAGSTENFIRGPYSATDGSVKAAFCRSCHYNKSIDYINNAGGVGI
jgi:hypothetical protein